MAADPAFHDLVMAKLTSLGDISSRPMFGGYGVFSDESMFGLISGSALFFKVDDSNRERYENAGCVRYKPMPYYQVPGTVLDNASELLAWAQESIAVARATPKKKRR